MLDSFVAPLLVAALQAVAPAATTAYGLPLAGAQAEDFLKTAEVNDLERFKTKGVTRPRRAILSKGGHTIRAVFKDVDEFTPVKKLPGEAPIMQFRDSYRHEIAAYELDKLLGLDIVPPCVKRTIGRDVGSLCLWVEGAMTEWERLKVEQIEPPDPQAWSEQMHTIKLFQQLVWDLDYKNASNLLVDPEFKIYKVDSSRAFRIDHDLRKEEALNRFSRSVLEALRGLEREQVDERLGPWLSKGQIDCVMDRRDRILEVAAKRIELRGEDYTLFD